MGALSGCVYDRYLEQSARTVSNPAVQQTPVRNEAPSNMVMQVDQSRYYADLAYRHVTVRRGDTLSMIADRSGVPLSAVIALNDARPPYYIYAGQLVKIPDFREHRVVGGETLYAISRVYDVEVAELVHFNFLSAPYELRAGEILKIPAKLGSQTQVAAIGSTAWTVSSNENTTVKSAGVGHSSSSAASKSSAKASVSTKELAAPSQIKSEPTQRVVREPLSSERAEPEVRVASLNPQIQSRPAPQEKVELQGAEIPANALPPLPRQRYSIKKPPSRDGSRFAWPAKGKIISGFGKKSSGFHNDGINIKLAPGTPVRAAENGVVSYVGDEMRSFGNLILISHADGYVTTYGHVAAMHVYKGQTVQKGEVIAISGASGDVSVPQLHFEIRKNGTAKNPMQILAAR
ncbi:LysM peptidoglycan-binding domain-containing M23 family metallopeptidase [Sneathiella glossodoripedis]|uniref:LysM peptidoglycan-binding domain-containing M23 family metallopeptidase n=1 Tax=Sneathiella glossodoripedis TaxID=418853 RepID=UPI00046F1AFB|nr:LysM peptidoglycan-binding domain-containing M23 family metallopeptidase [Sneathiella glossodoripedis]